MTQLIIAGLVLLCLLSVGTVAYLARALARLRREQTQQELRPSTPRLSPTQVEPSSTAHISAQVESPLEDDAAAQPQTIETAASDPVADALSFATTAETAADSLQPSAGAPTAPDANTVDETSVYALAWAMDSHYQQTSRPSDLRHHEYFRKGVEVLRDEKYSTGDLIEIARGTNVVAACIALETLGERADADDVVTPLLTHINEFYYWPGYYALRALDRRAGARPVLVPLLLHIKGAWGDYTPLQSLREFVA
ncbi:MAG TPA: hypothetical protein VER76_20165, partial [Pyrinomonadaceae bacterium]|nr:hypothetical protein [Pyrinomonadaceae bacterium]